MKVMKVEEQYIFCTLIPEQAVEALTAAFKKAKSLNKQAIIADSKAFAADKLLQSLPSFTAATADVFVVIVHSAAAMTAADNQNLTTDGKLIVLPSHEEAVDAVFMHLLEQEFNEYPDSEI